MSYQIMADAVLLVHFGIVVFVVGGLAVVPLGARLRWSWVRNRGFRCLHLAAIAMVALQAWFGLICPLTTLETWLRVSAGSTGYSRSFVEDWLQRLIYFEAPFWVFTLAYTVFGLLVLAAWWYVPPRRRGNADALK